ncbi:MAG: AbrB/MazE/SpoVT family DNA-binding domain-containing protein [Gallionella sp.]|nr:AbrB/MazE/SpoVT family DNA-binding domain-containing protein [Gallionella sp.]
MLEATLSERYQIAIPEEIRTSLHLKAGQKLSVLLQGDTISLIPKPSIKLLRGVLKGANTQDERDRNDRP